jgi:soluble lytic murein transglycosylase
LLIRLPASRRGHILDVVNALHFSLPVSGELTFGRITQFLSRHRVRAALFAACLGLASPVFTSADESQSLQREAFSRAWQAAASGDRAEFEHLFATLQDYLLYPYLQYEDFRQRRAQVDDLEMARFLSAHTDWAFRPGLEAAWLSSLARRERWDSLLTYAADASDTEVRCAYTHARIRAGQTDGLLPIAQSLWAVGRSQPEACDPVFRWLQQQDGISSGLAWQRIRLAMEAGQPRLSLYLARFLAEAERVWAERWYQMNANGYRRLDEAVRWPDGDKSRDIAEFGMLRLARSDPDRAWRVYRALEGHFLWPRDTRHGLLRQLALWSAVNGSAGTTERMQAVPDEARDDKLLEWAARHGLATGAWPDVLRAIDGMSPGTANDSRWRYWKARALTETGARGEAEELLAAVAGEAGYHGFLAADRLRLPYVVCPESPSVSSDQIEHVAGLAGFQRSLELRRAGVRNWARSEWSLAARNLEPEQLRAVAGLAVREDWPSMAIFALGNSGDQRWYEWRFPLDYGALVESNSIVMNLDPSWVMGLMRSESAMAEDALSSAGARGLMQVTPGTASQLAKRHGYSYTGPEQLMRAEDNVRFGTTYLRDLLDRFDDNPVLVSGAYNAGPNAVDRWLKSRAGIDPAIWVETLPYFETRDYIPRVFAFATLYDWRLQRPVVRVSSRMPAFDSGAGGGTMQAVETTEIVCRATG